jgi:hypothetical protein
MRCSLAPALLAAALMGSGPALAEGPAMALSFGFEPRVGNYAALDDRLAGYGFTPVKSAFLPAWGLRGRALFGGGSFAQMSMTYGIAVAGAQKIPTVTTLIETAGGPGYLHSSGVLASVDFGFSVLTHAVASELEGGALVYKGPLVHPRVGWGRQFGGPVGPFVALVVGATLQLPAGPAHSIPLWEEPFERRLVSALTVGIESGLGLQHKGE